MLFLLYLYHCYQRGVWGEMDRKRDLDITTLSASRERSSSSSARSSDSGQRSHSSHGRRQTPNALHINEEGRSSPSNPNSSVSSWNPSNAFNQAAGYGVVDPTSPHFDGDDAYHESSSNIDFAHSSDSDDEGLFEDCGGGNDDLDSSTDSLTEGAPTNPLRTAPIVVDIL